MLLEHLCTSFCMMCILNYFEYISRREIASWLHLTLPHFPSYHSCHWVFFYKRQKEQERETERERQRPYLLRCLPWSFQERSRIKWSTSWNDGIQVIESNYPIKEKFTNKRSNLSYIFEKLARRRKMALKFYSFGGAMGACGLGTSVT